MKTPDHPEPSAVPTADDDADAPTTRPTILIVDDLPANLGVLLDFLDTAGFEVLVAESGESALLQLAYARPDIILLDVTMPGGMDGFATCARLKADPRWQNIPVLFLTALSEPVDKVRGFAAGAVDFITKPLFPEEVLARVRAHLQIRALQRTLEEHNALLQHAIARRIEAEEQLQQSLDRAVLVVRGRDEAQFCTRLARRLLDRYFPDADAPPGRLPASLADWAAGAGEGANQPWHTERNGARLEVRRFAEPGGTATAGSDCFMLLLEETPRPDGDADTPARLLRLGLTTRETEVLYWIAHGKTSPEIAVILDAAVNTVKKHVSNILEKLGVETRLSAALRAVEILGLPGVDAARFRAE